MSKRYSGKSFKDSSVMKKPKLTFKEKRKLKEKKKKEKMKMFLGIVVQGQLIFSNDNERPKWKGKAIKVCRGNQDIDLSIVWF